MDGVLGSAEAQAIVPHVVQKIADCQKKNMTIVCTMDTHDPDVYADTDEGRKIPIHCVPSSPENGWNLHPDILAQLGELDKDSWRFVKKHAYGSSRLSDKLRRLHPDYVELVGLCTDVCVVSNAIIARSMLPRATIVVDASCCAGVTKEGHKAALQVLKSCGVDVTNEE